jgi:hypothetical protein
MKRSLLAIAVISGFMFLASSAFANPALLKKKHEGYPNQGQGTTATGEGAALKSAEDAPKTLGGQLKEAGTSSDRAGNVATDDPRQRKHPGYPEAGVTEGHIKNATKVNASPK